MTHCKGFLTGFELGALVLPVLDGVDSEDVCSAELLLLGLSLLGVESRKAFCLSTRRKTILFWLL